MTKTVTRAPNVTAHLRLLETTDLHANVMPFDYFSDTDDKPFGLARTATLIRAARAEARNVMLFDNGDALQGTPLADITAQEGSGWDGPNPVITAMNTLGYDAATLGNHEFNFGLAWLVRALGTAQFPITCANIKLGMAERALLPPYLLLKRQIYDNLGAAQDLTVGVIGLVPAQITTWDQGHLQGRLTSLDMVETARDLVPQLRAEGAEIVVMLAHTGIYAGPHHRFMENAALPLAAIPGVTAILTGHSHSVFPHTGGDCDPPQPTGAAINHAAGTLSGTPAVMAGSRGSHLGIVDLTLERRAGMWHVSAHRSEARPVQEAACSVPTPPDAQMLRAVAPAHRLTRQLISAPIGKTPTPLHSYLALVRPNPAVRLINRIQHEVAARALHGTADADLPLLSATPPFKTGGRSGPQNYFDIPAGPIALRHAADLYPFPNTLCALRVTGAELHDWLERSVICFAQITPGAQDAVLHDPDIPGHDFDVIDGLTYAIDLTQPARYDRFGDLRSADHNRIQNLRYKGRPLAPDARFILATNSYRAFGGGAFPKPKCGTVAYQGSTLMRDEIVSYLRNCNDLAPLLEDTGDLPTWRFIPQPGTSVLHCTGPGLRAYRDDIASVDGQDLGLSPAGFLRLRIPL
ncbi:bifunctional 2',3'-cyclic-nucleotide 2'-phosphodiesterase/3'-nucleotidase [Roseovarius sp. LXJ103]|uniref:bifunctional 2',3'-cyclic-nucleotide 2'-phosphodiesterase/3'-nucleotidase n=1 Tax=Roseovarius carneus TaxID=2853164 RepID=UPI0015E80113|nr:bifunctional 2',3'-cyclic-nucleotide 2'-phosphodiesterase/3'-nucleotidase [Roseovarius carneus]MBZ8117365.1 bifunctional 2',3'-cyclic-nucleotide 2'-phosphodiesterase/3'-nucleotidase [Roseovarius carneus]